MKIKVYLCSRVAQDARPLNNEVASALRGAGFDVFVPHEQPVNNYTGASDKEIYVQDMTAMKESQFCVAVGRMGVDCSFELGWFQGRGLPIYKYESAKTPTVLKRHWFEKKAKVDRHPMHFEVQKNVHFDVQSLVAQIKDETGG